MEFFQNWANCILLTIVISGILEFMTAEGETKKFVYLVLGIVTSMMIVAPVVSVVKGDFDLESVFALSSIEDNSFYMETLNQVEVEQVELLQEVYADNVVREFKMKYPHINLSGCNIQFMHDAENKIKEIYKITVYVEHSVEDASFVKEKIAEICEVEVEKVSVRMR